MHIIGVQDDDVAVQILCRLFRRIGGDGQGERMTTASSRDKTFFFILLPPLKAREMTSRGMDIV